MNQLAMPDLPSGAPHLQRSLSHADTPPRAFQVSRRLPRQEPRVSRYSMSKTSLLQQQSDYNGSPATTAITEYAGPPTPTFPASYCNFAAVATTSLRSCSAASTAPTPSTLPLATPAQTPHSPCLWRQNVARMIAAADANADGKMQRRRRLRSHTRGWRM